MQKYLTNGLLLGIIALSGCATYPGIFYAEHTQFGLQVKVNPRENKPVDINMGYDRGTFTVVPRMAKGQDAASVISKNDLCVKFHESSVIRSVYASGEAAKNIAKDPARMTALVSLTDPTKTTATPASGSCE